MSGVISFNRFVDQGPINPRILWTVNNAIGNSVITAINLLSVMRNKITRQEIWSVTINEELKEVLLKEFNLCMWIEWKFIMMRSSNNEQILQNIFLMESQKVKVLCFW